MARDHLSTDPGASQLRAVSLTKEAAVAFTDADVNGDKRLSFQEVHATICYHAAPRLIYSVPCEHSS